jgi:hypothetical protein
VQQTSILYFEFTTQHALFPGAMVEIQIPEGLKLPVASSMKVIAKASSDSAFQYSCDAKEATIVDARAGKVQLKDFILGSVREGPYTFAFGIEGITNQVSVKDAGGF